MSYKLKTVSMTNITRLPFTKELCNFVYRKDNVDKYFTGLIYKVDTTTFDKVINIFKGNSRHAITKGDKVYILPGHSLSKVRIKEYLKTNKATLTDDITKATAIAGLSIPNEEVNMHGTPLFSSLMFELSRCGHFNINNIPDSWFEESIERACMKDELDHTLNTITSVPAYNILKRADQEGDIKHDYNQKFITAKGMEILYYVLTKKIKILTEEYIGSNANSTVKLEDDEVYESILTMLESSDRSTYSMGIELLIHADLKGRTLYKLYKLAKAEGWKVLGYTKSKSVKHFLAATNWFILMNLNEESFLDYMKENGQLDILAIKELIPIAYDNNLEQIKRRNNQLFFSIDADSNAEKTTISLNEEWSKYLKMEEDEFINQV